MVVGDAEETIHHITDGKVHDTKKNYDMLFVRGDSVILFSSPILDD